MDETVRDWFTKYNQSSLTNFCAQSVYMSKPKKPIADGDHPEFAQRFLDALAWAEWLEYDPKTGEKLKGSYELVAKNLGISKVYVGDLLRGRAFPSGKKGADIAAKLGISANWLTNNEGPMVSDSLISIEHLLPEDRQVVRDMIRAMERKA